MNDFWKGETYHIVKAMKATGNRPGVIAEWKEKVAAWAQTHRTDPDAAAVIAWLPLWQPRAIYKVEELAPMWPALAIATGFTDKWPAVLKSPARLANELIMAGLPFIDLDDGRYFIVERIHLWRTAPDSEWYREIFG